MRHSILLVDDEPILRSSTKSFLEEEEFFVKAVATADETVVLVRQKPIPFSLALVDYHRPGANGPELTRWLREINPPLTVVGFHNDPSTEAHNELLDSDTRGLPNLLQRHSGTLRRRERRAPASRAATGG